MHLVHIPQLPPHAPSLVCIIAVHNPASPKPELSTRRNHICNLRKLRADTRLSARPLLKSATATQPPLQDPLHHDHSISPTSWLLPMIFLCSNGNSSLTLHTPSPAPLPTILVHLPCINHIASSAPLTPFFPITKLELVSTFFSTSNPFVVTMPPSSTALQ